MKNTSYKEMIRNRISELRNIDLALKWCKAKERWVEHTYDSFINIYVEKKDRYEAVRIILGISSKNREFDFHSSIAWDNLDDYETKYWESVESWVNWFEENLESINMDIHNKIDISYKYPDLSTNFIKYLKDNLL